ncbi:hypothetical protein C1H46_015539 [Malus baccata]|uniref:RNA helicase n=1 Tax=Malus baccata TaxID=106549 RepID=A0A540MJC8_MALBA|nr:hypothetical protein C1H46_015539 [Malus baccata]
MGRKTKETSAAVGEAEPQRTQPLHETTAERRKKQKNKDEEEAQLSSNPKRLLLRKKTQILLTRRRRRRSTRNPKRRKGHHHWNSWSFERSLKWVCCLKEVSITVLDEADRMLDMGFEPEVRYILGQTCSARQMVMFRATWPPSVHQLAQEFMDPNPVKVVVGSEDLAANHDVMQIVEALDEHSCDGRLVALLEKCHKSKENRVLIFVLYRKEATCVEIMLQKGGWKVVSIHGDKAQSERTKALSLFKKGSCPLMGELFICIQTNVLKGSPQGA